MRKVQTGEAASSPWSLSGAGSVRAHTHSSSRMFFLSKITRQLFMFKLGVRGVWPSVFAAMQLQCANGAQQCADKLSGQSETVQWRKNRKIKAVLFCFSSSSLCSDQTRTFVAFSGLTHVTLVRNPPNLIWFNLKLSDSKPATESRFLSRDVMHIWSVCDEPAETFTLYFSLNQSRHFVFLLFTQPVRHRFLCREVTGQTPPPLLDTWHVTDGRNGEESFPANKLRKKESGWLWNKMSRDAQRPKRWNTRTPPNHHTPHPHRRGDFTGQIYSEFSASVGVADTSQT